MNTHDEIPVIIITRNPSSAGELKDYLDKNIKSAKIKTRVCTAPKECEEYLDRKHYNYIIMDYDQQFYDELDYILYKKPKNMMLGFMFSNAYDTQVIMRKSDAAAADIKTSGTQHHVAGDNQAVAGLLDKLLSQRPARRKFTQKNYFLAAGIVLLIIIMYFITK